MVMRDDGVNNGAIEAIPAPPHPFLPSLLLGERNIDALRYPNVTQIKRSVYQRLFSQALKSQHPECVRPDIRRTMRY
jgi:hypothetical protein